MELLNYTACIFYSEESNCGEHIKKRKIGVFNIQDLDASVNEWLVKEGIKNIDKNVSECDLISSRCGRQLQENDNICAFHRYNYGLYWRAPYECQHPFHEKIHLLKKKKCSNVRVSSWKVYKNICNIFPDKYFPIGGVLCNTHRKNPETGKNNGDESAEVIDEYNPSKNLLVLEENRDEGRRMLQEITTTFAPNMSPIKFQITSPVEELSSKTISYAKKKYKEAVKEFKRTFCESLAPLQGEELARLLSSDNSEDEHVHSELMSLHKVYQSCQNEKSRMLVLSAIPKDYTKQEIMKVFQCTKYKIDRARKWQASYGACGQPKHCKNIKFKMNMKKAEHFLDFLFVSGAIQDVAYGVTNLKFDSGERQVVPRVVLTALRSHTIASYLEFCKDVQYESLHRSSLWKILDVIKPSQRHCLAGLDNTMANGLEGFEEMNELLKSILDGDTLKHARKQLEESKRYLKIGYATHCRFDATCASHCTSHSLSNPKDECFQVECTVPHSSTCDQCDNIMETIDFIAMSISRYEGEQKEDLKYDFENAKLKIMEWMSHIIRGVQQNEAKVNAFAQLNEENGLWIRDWAQKVLPVKYRESQKEYFGKKGLSLHIDVFFYKSNDTLMKSVYFTVISRSDQDVYSTLCVAEVVIKQFQVDYPNIKILRAKSDNAGCYSGNGYIESEYLICKKNGIELKSHDFNEPQKGKDQADRESAIAKKYMTAYLDSGNNLVTPEDVKKGILYKGGVKHSKVAIIEVNKENASFQFCKIEGISTYHSVSFSENVMTFWQYYGIGMGKKIEYKNCKFTSGAVVIDAFSRSEKQLPITPVTTTQRVDRSYNSLHFCPQEECTETFGDMESLDEHLTAGTHTFTRITSTLDKVRLTYSGKLKLSTCVSFTTENETLKSNTSEKSVFETGWALPERKKTRFTFKQKQFIYNIFIKGQQTGIKSSPQSAVTEMREKMDHNGRKLFQQFEYLTTSQIRSLFSNMASQQRKGSLKPPKPSLELVEAINDDLEDNEEDDIAKQVRKHFLVHIYIIMYNNIEVYIDCIMYYCIIKNVIWQNLFYNFKSDKHNFLLYRN